MRWLLLLVSVVGFGFAFRSGTPGALALSLLVAFGSLVAAVLAFAAARIESRADTASSRAATLVAMSRGKRTASLSPTATTTGDGGSWSPIDEGRHDHRGHDRVGDGDFAGDSSGGDSGGDGGGGGGGD